ncbi:hypothetical protein [Nocardia sp. CC201C]|uniref:hypothetical protein n=1 Tax=Nocardia sp. CC201C TaxID=3044575 RepID=UPI0024A92A96|nr:hypothetical protein [Nocardia sp. CC201C]
MTLPFAEAHVSAQLDWNDLDDELDRRVAAAAEKARKTLQEKLDKWSLTAAVKLNPAVGDFRRTAREKLAQITVVKDVELRTTAAELNKWTLDLRDRLKRKAFRVNVTPRLDMTALNAQLANLPEARVNVTLRVTAAEAARFARDLRKFLRDADFRVPIRPDLTNAAAFSAALDQLTRDRTVDVRANMRGGLGGLGGLGRGLSIPGIAKLATGITAVTAAIAALGGAAGAALGAVGALAVGLAALGPAAIAGISTLTVGLGGVKDAFSALSSAEESAASDAQAQAKAIKSATDQVTAAEKANRDAKKDSKQAEQDLTRARKDATKQMRDLNLEVRGGVLSEKEAQLDLADARKELANLKPGDDYERAQLRVAKAEQALIETRYRNHDLAEKQQESLAKGVEGSDLVTAAQDRLTAAQERVDETTSALADAQTALNEAMTQSSGAQDKAAQALAKLSPNARAWVLAVREIKPAWESLVATPTQDALFAGAAEGITSLAEAALPVLGRGMTLVATQMNALTHDFAKFWKAQENLAGIESIFAGAANFIAGMGPGLKEATTGFLSLGKAFEPVAGQIGASVGGLFGQIGAAFTTAFESGALTQLISTFGTILDGLGSGLNALIGGLIEMGNIVGPTLGPLFATLGAAIAELAPSLGQLGATFVTTLTELMPTLTTLIDALARGLEPVLPVIGSLLDSLGRALIPLVEPMSQIAQVVGTALVQAIDALAPAIGPLGEAFASMITAFAPIIPVIAEIVSGILSALAPALTTIFEALGPVIKQVGELLMPVFEQLQPILAQVAQQFGQAIASAIQQLAPHLPAMAESFGGLVAAIAPLLPQLLEIAMSLLPPLMNIIIAILPQIQMMIDAFTWLVRNVIEPYVIPYFEKMATTIGDQMNNVATIITTVRDILTGAFDTILGGIKTAVRAIGEFLTGLPEIKIPDLPGIPGRGTTIGLSGVGRAMVNWANSEGFAEGGRLIRGPGTGRSDSIPALLDGIRPLRVANGEFISTAQAYENGAPLLEALNAGWVPSPEFLRMLFTGAPGFAQGGLVTPEQLVTFAKDIEGQPYKWGGVAWGDCSGAMSALANYVVGKDPFGTRFATGNMESALAAMGAQPGLGPKGSLSFGWFNGGPYGGHTSATLPNGTNVEMGGQRGDGQYGGQAAGANDPMYTDHAHFPPEFFLGGDPKTTSSGGTPAGQSGSTLASGAASLSQTATRHGGGGAPVIGATGEPAIPDLNIDPATGAPATGIDAANRWAEQQNFGEKFQNWGIEALKEIVGEFADPFGLTPLTDMGIDRGVEALRSVKVAEVMNFYGYDPQKIADETGRMLSDRMNPVSETYRAG